MSITVDLFVCGVIQVGLSVVRVLLGVARPTPRKLGRVGESSMFRDVEQYPESQPIPGVLALQLGWTIWFANCGYLRERFLRLFSTNHFSESGRWNECREYGVFCVTGF